MDFIRASSFGKLAASRFPQGTRLASVPAVVSPNLVAAVLAVEMLERGWLARAAERWIATLLTHLRCHGRVERMSLGIAQIQPRALSVPASLEGRVTAALDDQLAPALCSEVIARIGRELDLDTARPESWEANRWRSFGLAYNGFSVYGIVLRSAFDEILARRGVHRRTRLRWAHEEARLAQRRSHPSSRPASSARIV